MSKPKRPKLPKLPSAWWFCRTALSEFRADWKSYVKILAIVAVPTNILSLVPSFASDPSVSPYISFAAVIMNVALIWAMVQRHATGKVSTLAEAYYDGSGAIVRYILATVLLVVMLIPAAFGISLYLTASFGTSTPTPWPELALVGFVSLLFALLSLYLLVRYGLGTLATIREGLRPFAALRRSRSLTLGRFWAVAGRFAVLVGLLVVLALPAAVGALILAIIRLGNFAPVFFEITTTLTALPIANLYLLILYRQLETSGPASAEPATEESAS